MKNKTLMIILIISIVVLFGILIFLYTYQQIQFIQGNGIKISSKQFNQIADEMPSDFQICDMKTKGCIKVRKIPQ